MDGEALQGGSLLPLDLQLPCPGMHQPLCFRHARGHGMCIWLAWRQHAKLQDVLQQRSLLTTYKSNHPGRNADVEVSYESKVAQGVLS
jgi:hypothetical protein